MARRAFSVALLLALPGIAVAADNTSEPVCHARAWVRAPDLEPGRVLQGDVKVKLDGMCTDVSSYSIGLRFAERSWVKTRQAGATLPERPATNVSLVAKFVNDSIFETGMFAFDRFRGASQSIWDKYHNDMRNPDLWLTREEERVGFEARYILREGDKLGHELIESFGILVPFTNYPPAFDMSFSGILVRDETDAADCEHIYEYFVDVMFTNGTHREIPAGYTSFAANIRPPVPVSETIKIPATRSPKCPMGQICPVDIKHSAAQNSAVGDEFTLELFFPRGRHVEQGSENNVTIISHQLGPALQCPLAIQSLRPTVKLNREWAAKLAVDNETAENLLKSGSRRSTQLLPAMDDETFYHNFMSNLDDGFKGQRFSSDGEIKNGTAFSTEALTLTYTVPHNCYPPFSMHYQTSEVLLEVIMKVRNISTPSRTSAAEDEKYDWTPKTEYTESLTAEVPIFVHPCPDSDAIYDGREPTHYLSSDARAPIFVDPSSIMELRTKTLDKRDELAPIAQAKFVIPEDDHIVKHRYYSLESQRGLGGDAPPYYVGDTWLRKVLARRSDKGMPSESARLIVQG